MAVAKLSGFAALILLLRVKGSRPIHLIETTTTSRQHSLSFAGLSIALVAVLWAYEGWHVVSFVAGEMKRPKLDLPRSLFLGTGLVLLIFLAVNCAYYHTLSAGEIRSNGAVAALAIRTVAGTAASDSFSVLILISVLGSMNGLILTGPRVYYAMASDGLFPRPFKKLNHRYRTPVVALTVQGIWAAVLAFSGSYQQLLTNVIFTAWIFYGLAVAGVVVLRHRQPELERPFLVPGYPWLSLMFCSAAVGLIVSTFIHQPTGSMIGIGLVASGLPLYFLLAGGRTTTL
jgi:APA family basic amino acid/polyamine antiporter